MVMLTNFIMKTGIDLELNYVPRKSLLVLNLYEHKQMYDRKLDKVGILTNSIKRKCSSVRPL